MAEAAARRAGLSTSAWMSRTARREAVRTGHGLTDPGAADQPALAEALADEADLAAAEEEMRAAG